MDLPLYEQGGVQENSAEIESLCILDAEEINLFEF